MKPFSKIILVWVVILAIGILSYSCEDPVDCSGFASRYVITGYSLEEQIFDGEYFSGVEILKDDTVRYDQVLLNLSASFAAIAENHAKGSFFTNAMACQPPILTPADSIANIQILSPDGTELSNAIDYVGSFNIVTFSEFEGFSSEIPLSQFNASPSPATTTIFLKYRDEPLETFQAGFVISITLTNGNVFLVSTKMFYISPD